MIGVYTLRCSVSGNAYVGSSRDVRARWNAHRCELRAQKHHCRALQSAWNKYGEDAFVFELLELCEEDALLGREQHWLDSGRFVYNSARVVGSPSELNRELARKRAREVLSKMPWTEERRAAAKARFAAMEHKPVTVETRAKMSVSAKARTGRVGPWTLRKLKQTSQSDAPIGEAIPA